ncbi:MAG: PAS domain S-box protein [Deltaproteobacteria bacterium]|nr:MAG: PAS domain S-box protein [Deltaproteobacteria bacterium]
MTEKQQPIKFGIGKKLLFYFLVLALLPMVISGAVSFFISRSQLQEKTKAHLSDLARDCGKKIDYYVSSRYQDIKLFSLAGVFKGDDTDAKQRFIEEAVRTYPFYTAISLLDLEGTIVACTREDLIGQSRADSPWFQKAVQSKGGEVISLDAYRSEAAGWELVIGLNTPITGENEEDVIGVLATRVGMDHIVDRVRVLDERTVGDNHAYLLNRRGEIIAGPDEKDFLARHRLFEFPVIQDLLAGKTGISEYENDRGEKVISARYALEGDDDFDGWGWGIVVTEPISVAYKGAYRIRTNTVIMGLAIALLVAVFAVFISRRFSRPITELSESALQISRGDLRPMDIAYGSTDEIGYLVSAFNKMTADLHETTVSRDSLAKEVAQRKLAEERIEHLNLVLRSIRKVNQIITHERDRDKLLKGACDNLIDNRGYYHAWIVLLDESGGVVATAEAGLGVDFGAITDHLHHGDLPDCARRALSQSEVLVTKDPLSDCADCPLLAAHKDGGAVTARLEFGDKVYGLLSASVPGNFVTDEEEQGLFKEVANDIALALQGLELEEKRKRAEEAVRKSEEKSRNILHGSPIPTFVIDKNHRVTYWNRALEEYSGIQSNDIVGTDEQWKAFYYKTRPCMADLLVDGKTDEITRWYPTNHKASDLIEGAHEAVDYFERIGQGGKWLYFTAAPLKDSEGNVIGAVETLQDITDTKKAEEQIRLLTGQVIEIEEKERESLSREIHDNIGQLLFALKMGLSRANKKIPKEFSAIKDQLTELSYLLGKVISEIRQLSHALHPPQIEDLGLIAALEGLCQDFKSYSEITIRYHFDEIQTPLPSIANITIYRLFQEGLNNILKHSHATEARLELTSSENTIQVVIQDNGVGFEVDQFLSPSPNTKTLGLISMRERLALIGGQLRISSTPGKGTTILATLERG